MAFYYGSGPAGGWMQAQQPFYVPAQHFSASSMFEQEMGFGEAIPNQFVPYYNAPPTHSRGHNRRGRWQGQFRGRESHQPHARPVPPVKEKTFTHFCSACDRGYNTIEKYTEHCATHVQCKIEGCKYTAAEKLVELHRRAQHRNGLFKRIWCLESPAELKRWIEERKRHYPSATEATRRAKNDTAKAERGQVLSGKRGRFNSRYQQKRRPQDERGNNANGTQDQTNAQRNFLIDDFEDEPAPEAGQTEHKTTAPQTYTELEWTASAAAAGASAKSHTNGQTSVVHSQSTALTQLFNMYADSDDEGVVADEHEREQAKGQSETCNDDSHQSSVPVHAGNARNREKRHRRDRGQARCDKPSRKRSRLGTASPMSTAAGIRENVRKSTLLESLLHNEMRHERNVILQCVRFIVNSRFFDSSRT